MFFVAWRLADFFIEVSHNSSGSPEQQCAYNAEMYGPSETRTYECPSPLPIISKWISEKLDFNLRNKYG